MSNGADCASTRAVVVDPSGRRSVTLALDDTTCTFVRTVSGVTKNPEPRPDDVSTTTTAGEARLTRSSSDAEAAAGVEGSASSGALRGGGAGSGVATASAGDGALGSSGLTSGSGRDIGLADAVTVRFAVSGAGRGRVNHQPPAAPTTANATIVRAAALVDDLHVGREQHPAAPAPDRGAEIHVLRVHEIPFVEQADRLGITPPHEQTGAAHPVGVATLPRERLDVGATYRPLLPPFVQRTDHPAER